MRESGIPGVHNAEDRQLLQRIAARDAAAFTLLVKRYLQTIVTFARRYTSQKADAEDVAQETFMRVWQHASNWRDGDNASVRSWIYRISYNLCMDLLRRRNNSTPIDELDLSCVYQQQPDAKMEQQQQMTLLGNSLRQLPVRQYTALSLQLSDALSYQEAASAMDISLQAYESLVARARRTLKKAFHSQQKTWEAS